LIVGETAKKICAKEIENENKNHEKRESRLMIQDQKK